MKSPRLFAAFAAALAVLSVPSALAKGGPSHVKVTAKLVPADVRAGETAQIVVTATMDDTWHIYAPTSKADVGIPTEIKLSPGSSLIAAPKVVQPAPEKKHDKDLNADYEMYEGAVAFAIPVKVNAKAPGAQKAEVTVKFQVCDPHVCLPPETLKVPVAFKVAPGPARANRTKADLTVPAQPAGYRKP